MYVVFCYLWSIVPACIYETHTSVRRKDGHIFLNMPKLPRLKGWVRGEGGGSPPWQRHDFCEGEAPDQSSIMHDTPACLYETQNGHAFSRHLQGKGCGGGFPGPQMHHLFCMSACIYEIQNGGHVMGQGRILYMQKFSRLKGKVREEREGSPGLKQHIILTAPTCMYATP